jgi:hypothetical protein
VKIQTTTRKEKAMKRSSRKALGLVALIVARGPDGGGFAGLLTDPKYRQSLREALPVYGEDFLVAELLEEVIAQARPDVARVESRIVAGLVLEELRKEDVAKSESVFRLGEQEAREAFEAIGFNRIYRRCECDDDTGFVCRRCARYWRRTRAEEDFELNVWFERVAERWAGFVLRARRVETGKQSKEGGG